MKKKSAAVFAAVYLLLSCTLTVFSISFCREPAESGEPWKRYTVDRVDVDVDKTSFTFERDEANAPLQLSFRLSLKKSEADLFAVIDSLSIEGVETIQTAFLCETPGVSFYEDGSFPLPTAEGEPFAAVFLVSAELPAPANGAMPELTIRFRSGLNAESAAPRVLRIPLRILYR